jgi:putative FmdB family regulatory protein
LGLAAHLATMPIYEYRCTACEHKLEALQKFSDAPLVTCPKCEQNALVKLVSAAGFQLKGSGWYQTDFRGGGSKPAPAKSDSAAGDAKPTDSAAATDSTPAKSEPAAKPASGTATTAS